MKDAIHFCSTAQVVRRRIPPELLQDFAGRFRGVSDARNQQFLDGNDKLKPVQKGQLSRTSQSCSGGPLGHTVLVLPQGFDHRTQAPPSDRRYRHPFTVYPRSTAKLTFEPDLFRRCRRMALVSPSLIPSWLVHQLRVATAAEIAFLRDLIWPDHLNGVVVIGGMPSATKPAAKQKTKPTAGRAPGQSQLPPTPPHPRRPNCWTCVAPAIA